MTAQEDLEAWLDLPDREMCVKARQVLNSHVLHVVWDKEENAIGMMTTCDDQTELLELVEWVAKRIRSGEHVASREEVRLV